MGTGPIAGALSGLTTCIMGVQSSPAQGAGAEAGGSGTLTMFWRWPRWSWGAVMQQGPREGQIPTVAVGEHAGQCGFLGYHLKNSPGPEVDVGHSSHHHCC